MTSLDKKACEGLVWLYAMQPCQNHSPSSYTFGLGVGLDLGTGLGYEGGKGAYIRVPIQCKVRVTVKEMATVRAKARVRCTARVGLRGRVKDILRGG